MTRQDWIEFVVDNCVITQRQKEFYKRGELSEKLEGLMKSINGYLQFSNLGMNDCQIKRMILQKDAAFYFHLILKDNLDDKLFYPFLIKTLTYGGAFENA